MMEYWGYSCSIWLKNNTVHGPKAWKISVTWLQTAATVLFLGPVLYHSNRFLARGLHRISEGLEVPLAFITVAVPLIVVIIFVHLIARLVGAGPDQSAGNG